MRQLKKRFTHTLGNRVIVLTLLVVTIVFNFSACSSFRSAKGLDGGTAAISYLPPAGLNLRIGVTDNIEARTTFIYPQFKHDLFFHTNFDTSFSSFNFGVVTGIRPGRASLEGNQSTYSTTYYYSFVISKQFERCIPYFTYTYDTHKKILSFYSLGSEIDIYNNPNKKLKINLIPEITYHTKNINYFMDAYTYISGTIGLGVEFDFLNLFQKL